jgi:hypothetical protein
MAGNSTIGTVNLYEYTVTAQNSAWPVEPAFPENAKTWLSILKSSCDNALATVKPIGTEHLGKVERTWQNLKVERHLSREST